MKHAFPLIPKRRLVARRAWDMEPESHQIVRDQYRGSVYRGTINPWIIRQLASTEQFNNTPSDKWRKD